MTGCNATYIFFCLLVLGRVLVTAEPLSVQTQTVTRITCQPRIVFKERQGLAVDSRGRDRSPIETWLFLTDGTQHFRIQWDSPGRGVHLDDKQTYTFFIGTRSYGVGKSQYSLHRVVQIVQNGNIIFEETEKRSTNTTERARQRTDELSKPSDGHSSR